MANAIDTVLAMLASSYETSENPIGEKIETVVAAKKKAAKKTATTYRPETVVKVPGPKSEPLPVKGTVTAEQFLRELPHCGKRPNKFGVLAFQGEFEKRTDEMRLIASYVGWDRFGLHGVQLENAVRAAKLELRPITSKEYRRGTASIAGYVAGMPDNVGKKIDDLSVREVVAAEALSAYNQKAKANDANKEMYETLSSLEEERIKEIRVTIKELQS